MCNFSTALQAAGLDGSMFPVWRALPQRELCAFILLKLNTKAVQTPGLFFHTLNTECLLECVWGREGAGGRNRWTKHPVRIADTVFIWLSCFFCVSPADLEQISVIIYLYLYNFQKEPHIYTARHVGLLRQHSAPSHNRRGYCRVSPSASSDSNAGIGMSFNSQGCLKKDKNTTSLC